MLNPALLTININANEMCLDINLNIKTRNITVIRKVINIYTNIYKRINVFLIIIIIYFNTRKNTKRIWYVHIRLATITLSIALLVSRKRRYSPIFYPAYPAPPRFLSVSNDREAVVRRCTIRRRLIG